MPRVHVELCTHWSSARPVRCAMRVSKPNNSSERAICNGGLSCVCESCCPTDPATIIFLHCSGRLRCRRVPPGSPIAVLNEASDFVSRSVGGARHHLCRLHRGGETLFADSDWVAAGEVLVIVLHGCSFHLSPLCDGDINSQWPLPDYASQWLEMPTTPSTSLTDYMASDRGALPKEEAPPIPCELYSLAFALRHGGLPEGNIATANPGAVAAGMGVVPLTLAASDRQGDVPLMEVSFAQPAPACQTDTGENVSQRERAVGARFEPAVDLSSNNPSSMLKAGSHEPHTPPKRTSKAKRKNDPPQGMCGFSAEDCSLLLSHGLKPWDEDAEVALQTLRISRRPAEGILI